MLDAYDRGLHWVLRHQALHPGGGRRHAGGHRLALCHRAQGPAAAAGHRPDPRRHRCRAVHFLQGHGRSASAPSPRSCGRIRTWSASPPSSAPAPSTRPSTPGRLYINLKPRDQRKASADRDHRPPARRHRLGRGHLPLHAGGAGRADRQPGQPHPIPIHPAGRRRERTARNGRPSC